jgi:TolB-like protein
MPNAEPADPSHRPPSVFLSYASEDRQAAQAIRDALPTLGLEVWYDESALNGGDAWDQKIRRQIRECDFFMPLVSAQTEARHEGYFRREWRLAVERTLDMADDHTFLLPVVIDDTNEAGARVPEKFLSVQWLRLPGGRPTAAFEALCRRLAAGQNIAPLPVPLPTKIAPLPIKKAPEPPVRPRSQPIREYPEFPREEPGQKTRFWVHVAGWSLSSAWIFFNRFPKWIRYIVYLWLVGTLMVRGCSSPNEHSKKNSPAVPAAAKKLETLSETGEGDPDLASLVKLGQSIASAAKQKSARSPLLAIPFSAPSGDPAARKLADSIFALVYGRVSISHHGQVGLTDEPLPSLDSDAAVKRGRAKHSTYVLYGGVDNQSAEQRFTVKIVTVEDGSVVWSESYPVAGADPAKIAAEVEAKVPSLQDPD